MHSLNTTILSRISDTHLIRETARGDDRLYAELVRRYVRAVYEFTREYATQRVAERLTSSIFYEFWKSLHGPKKVTEIRTRLFEIAEGKVTQSRRGKSNQISHGLSLYNAKTFSTLGILSTNTTELADYIRGPVQRLGLGSKMLQHDLKRMYSSLFMRRS